MSALRKPSEITEPGWYWAEERNMTKDGASPWRNAYDPVVIRADALISGVLCFEADGDSYDAATADAWFRIISRIDEPEITGGWG